MRLLSASRLGIESAVQLLMLNRGLRIGVQFVVLRFISVVLRALLPESDALYVERDC